MSRACQENAARSGAGSAPWSLVGALEASSAATLRGTSVPENDPAPAHLGAEALCRSSRNVIAGAATIARHGHMKFLVW